MKTLVALLIATGAFAAGAALASPVLHPTQSASMLGDSVHVDYDNYGYGITNYGDVVVQPQVSLGANLFKFTFDATSIRMSLRVPVLGLEFEPDEFDRYLLSSIDTPNDLLASIAGVTIRSSHGVRNFGANDIAFSDHSLALSMVGTQWDGDGELIFDLQFQTTAEPEATVPEPGSLALVGSALMVLGAAHRRTRRRTGACSRRDNPGPAHGGS